MLFSLRKLASVRRFWAAAVLGLFCLALLGWGEGLLPFLGLSQAGMVLTAFLAGATVLYTVLALGQLALALVCGRVFCSWLCPLGLAQDLYRRLFGLLRGRFHDGSRTRLRFIPATPWRYVLPGLLLVSLLWQGPRFFGLAEPFSLFARAMHALGQPLAALTINALAEAGDATGLFTLAQTVWHPDIAALALAGVSVLLVFALAGDGPPVTSRPRFWSGPRGYCNSICPVGALLGLVGAAALLRPRFTHVCTGCGRCANDCKSRCIDTAARSVDASRCVACYTCLERCPSQGLALLPQPARDAAPGEARQKRAALLRGLLVATGTALAGFRLPLLRQGAEESSAAPPALPAGTMPVLPPGALSLAHLEKRCTGCHSCLAVCPPQVLRMSGPAAWGADGPARMALPAMDYLRAFCQIACVRCTQVCPSGALRPLSLEEKARSQIGRAALTRHLCVIVTEKTRCGACAEHCPTGAVSMGPDAVDGMPIPVIDQDRCIGCGGCQYACPVRPRQAVVVMPLAVHALALPPRVAEGEAEVKGADVFPF